MEFGQLMIDILVNISCKFEMFIFKIAEVINDNVRIAFLYVLRIVCSFKDPGVTLTYFMARSKFGNLGFSMGKSENSGFF